MDFVLLFLLFFLRLRYNSDWRDSAGGRVVVAVARVRPGQRRVGIPVPNRGPPRHTACRGCVGTWSPLSPKRRATFDAAAIVNTGAVFVTSHWTGWMLFLLRLLLLLLWLGGCCHCRCDCPGNGSSVIFCVVAMIELPLLESIIFCSGSREIS